MKKDTFLRTSRQRELHTRLSALDADLLKAVVTAGDPELRELSTVSPKPEPPTQITDPPS